MSPNLGFAYSQARIQARFAGLPQEDEWQRLAASRTLASFLEEARTGPLRGWVKGFSGQSGVHELEAGVRSLHREMLDEVASWVPTPWKGRRLLGPMAEPSSSARPPCGRRLGAPLDGPGPRSSPAHR